MEQFFIELDKKWKPTGIEPIRLPVIGCSALLLQIPNFYRGTKDGDVLELHPLGGSLSDKLKQLAGKGTMLSKRCGVYIDLVGNAIPFLPRPPEFKPLDELSMRLKNFKIDVLDTTDVIVSKLMPYRASDRDDIFEIIELGLLSPDKLIERFETAKEMWLLGSRAAKLPQCIANLNAILRDAFNVAEVSMDVPDWIHEV